MVDVGRETWEEPDQNTDENLRETDSGFSHVPRPTSAIQS